MKVELDRIEGVVPEWERLAAASGCPFATVEWTETWLEHAAGPYVPELFLARDEEGRPAAIVPLVIAPGRHAQGALPGLPRGEQVGPICAPDDAEVGLEALRQALKATRRDWDVFVAENLPGTGWDERLSAKTIGSNGSPIVRGPWLSWDEYLASRSHNLRSELRRKERRLEEQGMRHRDVRTAEELEPALDALFDLHRGRWGSEASPFFSNLEPFHRAFARVAAAAGYSCTSWRSTGGRSRRTTASASATRSGRTSSGATSGSSTRRSG